MSNPVNQLLRFPLRLILMGALALTLLAGCATGSSGMKPHQTKTEDAAVYNTQLGIAYLNQGDLALAKDKLDRAVLQDPEYSGSAQCTRHAVRAHRRQRQGRR